MATATRTTRGGRARGAGGGYRSPTPTPCRSRPASTPAPAARSSALLGDDGEPLVKWEGRFAEDLLAALGRVPALEREVIRVRDVLPVSEWEV